MTPEEKKLYALMAVAEQQQNLVNQAVKELQITEERIQKVIAVQTHSTVSKSLNKGLEDGTTELLSAARSLGRLNNSIDSVIHQWSWKLITIVLGAFAILMIAMTWLFVGYIKPLGNIPQIESLKRQGIQFDIGNCKVEGEAKTCVRVMKKQCGYGKNGDFCVIDPK